MRVIAIPAKYRSTGVARYRGNPLIEALPPLPERKMDLLSRIENYPDVPSTSVRKSSELVRLAELRSVSDLVYPMAEYKAGASNLEINLREAYVARNPLSEEDLRRRHLIALAESTKQFCPGNWRSSATGQMMVGMSGSGKSTLIDRWSLPYQVVIEHTSYKGKPFAQRQVPFVKLRLGHDSTLKSLCIQFFSNVDEILGTDYARQARSIGSIGQMSLLMGKVATAIALAMVCIDETQNLKAARGGNAEFVLNLFSELIEHVGVTLVVVATPAIESVIDKTVRNLRKLETGGMTTFPLMSRKDSQWLAYTERLWKYQFVKNVAPLTEETLDAWAEASGCNPAFTSLSFVLAQEQSIGSTERVDAASFKLVANTSMALLEPAIRALHSRDADAISRFDDLLFKEDCQKLRRLIGWKDEPAASGEEPGEFDEVEAEHLKREKKRARARPSKASPTKPSAASKKPLPTENPLLSARRR